MVGTPTCIAMAAMPASPPPRARLAAIRTESAEKEVVVVMVGVGVLWSGVVTYVVVVFCLRRVRNAPAPEISSTGIKI